MEKKITLSCVPVFPFLFLGFLLLSGCLTSNYVTEVTAGSGTKISDLKSFCEIGKEKKLFNDRETVLLEHSGKGCLTHMWFGGDWPGYDKTVLRVYVDGEKRPSIEAELFQFHGIGWGEKAAPWGNELLGKTGHPSGLYNTFQIPFERGVKVTAQLAREVQSPKIFWWIVRGVENLNAGVGNIQLPSQARLKLIRKRIRLKPLQFVDLCDISGRGFFFGLFMAAESENYNFLETCLRASIDGAGEPLFLSSGTEDYFLGTYYFNRGGYHLPMAGLTHKGKSGNGLCRFSAYRFHTRDPIVFQKKFRLLWRNGEEMGGHVFGSPKETTLTTYVWIYVWKEETTSPPQGIHR